jgi:hypothetical protein
MVARAEPPPDTTTTDSIVPVTASKARIRLADVTLPTVRAQL